MSWLGDLVGIVAAAPARILNVPIKALEASVEGKVTENALDDVAKAVEDAAKKVVDGEAKP